MNQDTATMLANRRFKGMVGEPLTEKPQDFSSAWVLQQQVAQTYCQLAQTHIGGWKCVLPTKSTTMLAPLFENTVYDLSSSCSLFETPNEPMALVEPEIVTVFDRDLPVKDQAYTEQEIDNAIGSTRLALELMQSRYQNPDEVSYFEAFSDGLLNQGVYLGPEVNIDLSLEAMSQFQLSIKTHDGDIILDKVVTHPNNHPRVAVYWLVNFLREREIGIKAGMKVITGSYAGIVKVPYDAPVNFTYGELGSMTVTFTRKGNG
ncbi:hydratase [Parashewanella curva]|uniref:Hydratase n=1 Tax=Parashewanella curva TaxID=2338552 RepID=A0A3L8Q0Y6_9GAMM|nr:hydratase [Parashewanella curva]RLV60468.1 hydratase [Parashewanella curva]